MRLAIVGNGPSAEGKGHLIDACDFVVRTKAFWHRGAKNAGNKCNAVAWYGDWKDAADWDMVRGCEQWIVQKPDIFVRQPMPQQRLDMIASLSEIGIIRWMSFALWQRCVTHLKAWPSTGFATIAMAISGLWPDRLELFGFDSTAIDRPNYWDAQHGPHGTPSHNVLNEKRLLARLIDDGVWMETPTKIEAFWHNRPEIP